MPKKKVEVTVLPESVKDINSILDDQLSKDLGVKIENGNIVEEKKADPADPIATEEIKEVKEEPKEVKEEKREEIPEFNEDEFAKKVADQIKAKEEESKRLEEEAKLKAEQEVKSKDEFQPVWKREGRQPLNYEEIVAESNRIADLRMEQKLAERDAKVAQEKKVIEEAQKTEQSKIDAYNKLVDEELEELYANDKLPKIKDQNDPNDLGVKERFNLFKRMQEVNQERISKGLEPIYSVHRIYNSYYKPTKQPAGADLPITGSKTASPAPQPEGDVEYSYADLHNKKSFLDFFKRR